MVDLYKDLDTHTIQNEYSFSSQGFSTSLLFAHSYLCNGLQNISDVSRITYTICTYNTTRGQLKPALVGLYFGYLVHLALCVYPNGHMCLASIDLPVCITYKLHTLEKSREHLSNSTLCIFSTKFSYNHYRWEV